MAGEEKPPVFPRGGLRVSGLPVLFQFAQQLVSVDTRSFALLGTNVLDNCRHAKLVDEALSGLSGAITEADLVRLLMQSETLQDALDVNSH